MTILTPDIKYLTLAIRLLFKYISNTHIYTYIPSCMNKAHCILVVISILLISCGKNESEPGNNVKIVLERKSNFLREYIGAWPSDTSGRINYTWDMGDGTIISSNNIAVHPYSKPGTFKITLKNNGKILDTSSVTIFNAHFSYRVRNSLSKDITNARFVIVKNEKATMVERYSKSFPVLKPGTITDSAFVLMRSNDDASFYVTYVYGSIKTSLAEPVAFVLESNKSYFIYDNELEITPAWSAYFTHPSFGVKST